MESPTVTRRRPSRHRWWWRAVAGLGLIAVVAIGPRLASRPSRRDKALLSALEACDGVQAYAAYRANYPAFVALAEALGGGGPSSMPDNAREARLAAKENAKYQPVADATDLLATAVRKRDGAQIDVLLTRTRQACNRLTP